MTATRNAPLASRSFSASPPVFLRVEPTPGLLVPLAGGRQGQVIAVRPAGTRLPAGGMLTETAPESGHIPVSPVTGVLGAARQVTLAGGGSVPAVAVHPDEARATGGEAPDQPAATHPLADDTDFTRENLPRFIDHLRRGGIHADRTAAPDLVAQLLLVLRRPVDTILCSLLDADPPLRLSATVAAHEPNLLVRAMALLRGVCGAATAAIAIDESAPAGWLADLRSAARAAGVRIVSLLNDYPQSDPTMLLHRLLRRRLRPHRLPVEQGVLMTDAAAAVAAGKWLIDGQPMTTVPVAVFDHVRREPHYAHVPIGTAVDTLLAALEIDTQHTTLRAGDLLRDIPLGRDHIIAGTTLCLHVLPQEAHPPVEPCIRCGWCVQGCPTRIQPAGLLDAAQRDDLALAERYGLEACIECGICAWVCPSHLPLLDGIRSLKKMRNGK